MIFWSITNVSQMPGWVYVVASGSYMISTHAAHCWLKYGNLGAYDWFTINLTWHERD